MINPVQQQIANHTEGPVLVIAGPVSGKTKTLVDIIVNFVKKSVVPESIVQTKKKYAQQIAAASKMEYIIVPGKKAKEKLVI